jgi:hypothetical protein
MIRKFCVLTAFMLALALPAAAQSQYCVSGGTICEFLENEGFENTPTSGDWVFGSSTWWATVYDPCAWGGGTTKAANLPANGSVRQDFTADNSSSWSVEFDVYFGDSGGTTNDKITVTVLNLDTNVSESFTVNATSYGLCASNVSFNLAGNYANANVRVTLRRGVSSTMNSMAVDNVSFWGYY